MQSNKIRVGKLEQASLQTNCVVFIILTGLGEVKELVHIYDNHGNQWHRKPNETETEFKDRAKAGTPRNEYGVAMVFGE